MSSASNPASSTGPNPETALHSRHVITRRAVFGWVTYDLANTIFQMGVISLLFPLYVKDVRGPESANREFPIIMAISMGIIFFASPLLGAMTDRARRRMPFLSVSMVVCVVLTMLMARFGYIATAILFVIANIAFQASL